MQQPSLSILSVKYMCIATLQKVRLHSLTLPDCALVYTILNSFYVLSLLKSGRTVSSPTTPSVAKIHLDFCGNLICYQIERRK